MPMKPWPEEVTLTSPAVIDMHVDIVPMRELGGHALRADGIVGSEVLHRLVGEDDAPAEGVARAVALEHDDLGAADRAASSRSRNRGRPAPRPHRQSSSENHLEPAAHLYISSIKYSSLKYFRPDVDSIAFSMIGRHTCALGTQLENRMSQTALQSFAKSVSSGSIRTIDLTQTLSADTPILVLPPPFGQCAPFKMEEISHYDERGVAWYWNNFTMGEHTGTHFDAPVHWVTGKDLKNNTLETIMPKDFIAPAVVLDFSKQCAENPDFLLSNMDIDDWEKQHGRIPARSWVLFRSDWSKRTGDAYTNRREDGAHTPGPSPEAVRFLVEAARCAGLRRRDDRHRCRTGASARADVSRAHAVPRRRALRAAMPDQSRSAAADRRGDRRRAAQDPERIGQPAARARARRRLTMAERSFKAEVEQLRIGAGEEFRGEGILAVTKALLQAGVAYVGGYQGAPISHLMDVFADADDLLKELGVHFETSASEAAAAAMCAASVNYPLRGAVAWKSVVGTNVASDALSNVASGGVTGGVLVIVGEDYGEGSSIMQERTHAFAMKSQIWLLDPRPNLPSIVEHGREGLRAVRGLEHAGDAGVARARLPSARPLHREGQYPPALHGAGRGEQPGARHRAHRAAARELPARAREDRAALAGGAVEFVQRPQAQ